MLVCGNICQPSYVEREIKAFESNASPIQVQTDLGAGFVKAPNNGRGEGQVIAELVCAELGTWFGLNIPPFSIIQDCSIDLEMKGNGEIMNPPLFYSSQVDGIPYDGSDELLSEVRDKNHFTKLIIFDTWLLNWDRYQHPHENFDNLLFVKRGYKYDVYAIDHTWAFNAEFPTQINEPDIILPDVYGNFPQFIPYVNYSTLTKELEKLSTLDGIFVEQIVNSVPPEWGLGRFASQALIDLICRRAEFVVNTLPARLISNPPIPGLQGNG